MSLILTPPPTVMVFFKEISLKNESTDPQHISYVITLLRNNAFPRVIHAKVYKIRKLHMTVYFSTFYDILQPNFTILLNLGCSFQLCQ